MAQVSRESPFHTLSHKRANRTIHLSDSDEEPSFHPLQRSASARHGDVNVFDLGSDSDGSDSEPLSLNAVRWL